MVKAYINLVIGREEYFVQAVSAGDSDAAFKKAQKKIAQIKSHPAQANREYIIR